MEVVLGYLAPSRMALRADVHFLVPADRAAPDGFPRARVNIPAHTLSFAEVDDKPVPGPRPRILRFRPLQVLRPWAVAASHETFISDQEVL